MNIPQMGTQLKAIMCQNSKHCLTFMCAFTINILISMHTTQSVVSGILGHSLAIVPLYPITGLKRPPRLKDQSFSLHFFSKFLSFNDHTRLRTQSGVSYCWPLITDLVKKCCQLSASFTIISEFSVSLVYARRFCAGK